MTTHSHGKGEMTAVPLDSSLLSKFGALARLAMGLVFLTAGAAKSWDPVIFYWEVVSYLDMLSVNRQAWHNIASGAIYLAPIEVAVGLALLLNWRSRFTCPVAVVMMSLFLGLTFYAWRSGANVDCGCFGALAERSPGQAAAEDAVMLGLLLIGWWRGNLKWPRPGLARAPVFAGAGVLVALAVTGLRFYPQGDRLAGSDLKPGMALQGLELKGVDVDLGSGSYLIELFNPKCPRCKKAVPKLNRWAESTRLPLLIGLNEYAQDSPELKEFIAQMRPRFDIATISSSDWMRLTAGHGWPRLAWIEDGVVMHVWEYDRMPTDRQLKKRLAAGTPGS